MLYTKQGCILKVTNICYNCGFISENYYSTYKTFVCF